MTGRDDEPARKMVITIVGGGTAGWMTAALLSRLFKSAHDIRLVESEEIGSIGVGEATIPTIRHYNTLLGVEEFEMVRATQATYKLGIEFVDWREPGHSYVHGFGKIGNGLEWFPTHQLWLRAVARGGAKAFDAYALNCLAARMNRFCHPNPSDPLSPMSTLEYAFHLDASLYAAFLRKRAERDGVIRIEGRIVDVALRGADGFVERLHLADGRTVDGDLFIDCSGFRALLIGQALGVEYEDWSRWLPCDRAVAVPSFGSRPLRPYTRATASAAGWRWRIPLQHRVGNGYVYSSNHISDDEATAALLAGLDAAPTAEPRLLRFRPGKRRRAWERNVVAIGLSSGFLEPLESTSIHLIQSGIERLVALFPSRGIQPAESNEYNYFHNAQYDDIRDFVIAHYKVTQREDTPFWAYVRNMDIPGSLAERLELFRLSARWQQRAVTELFRLESWVQILIGQGLPMRHDALAEMISGDRLQAHLREIESVVETCARAMPAHEDFIRRFCAAPTAIGRGAYHAWAETFSR